MKKQTSILILVILGALLLLAGGGAQAAVFLQCPPDLDGVDTDGDGIVDNDHVCVHLGAGDGYAVMADGNPLYIFGFSRLMDGNTLLDGDMAIMEGFMGANWPAPTLAFKEGQRVFLNLTNVGMMMRPDLFDPHSVHWHGFPNAAPIFDGVPDASMTINMLSTFTYYYSVLNPGTFIWHCHVEATEHMQMGMMGQLYVTPIQNQLPEGTDLSGFLHHAGNKYIYNDGDGSTYYDREYPIQLGSFDPDFHNQSESVQPLDFAGMRDAYPMLNGRGYPDTLVPAPIPNLMDGNTSQKLDTIITATQGEKVLLRLSSLSTTDFFTVTTLGIPMKVVGRGANLLRGPDGKDLSQLTQSVTLGGGEAVDVILDTADVEPGTYFLFSTNLHLLANYLEDYGGMMTEIIINAP